MFVQSLLMWRGNRYNILLVCICSLRYPACNAHAPYSVAAQLYNIFPHYLVKSIMFEKMLLNTKCVFWFSLQLLSEIFFIPIRIGWDTIKKMYTGVHVKYLLFFSNFNETGNFLGRFSKKYSNTKFHENPSSGSWVIPCGQAHKAKLSHFLQFCEHA